MTHRIPITTTCRHQRGAVLFVALVFLILITLLALTATGTSILQEKMTGGMRNRQLGLMGSESALRGGEALFTTADYMGSNPLPKCAPTPSSGVCAYPVAQSVLSSASQTGSQLSPVVQAFRTKPGWVAAPGGTPTYPHTLTGFSGDAETASLHAQPLLMIEDLGTDTAPGLGQQTESRDSEYQRGRLLYRITGRSQGGSGAVVRVTESTYSALAIGNAGANPGATP
ncbi:pilus assembly PilX family protein [Dokdonella fugitiva]|jgi:type IV pilus assembly protein PilX|uniref:Type IV pilus assembly protein PilX n=1 Tax=Dokdonella fugitiva TaxID=328517 RepID=A0A4R2IE47_9GAMM|nr:PilX N-terminal domain-containing pilus assembly protein [Dokdonella fugitiva]MBA8883880.1 type IV pilus assembly protein PilX [Dokdonella fugitiva]TCO41868.1 type IV pilus assembly protein PilX [Dokdonella fugitiva]